MTYHRLDGSPEGINRTIFTACRLAQLFPDAPPPVESLEKVFGMSRANAYRWVAAWKAAQGINK